MSEEFKLSERYKWLLGYGEVFKKKDVKEFIKRLKEELIKADKLRPRRFHCDACKDWTMELIDELAGDLK